MSPSARRTPGIDLAFRDQEVAMKVLQLFLANLNLMLAEVGVR